MSDREWDCEAAVLSYRQQLLVAVAVGRYLLQMIKAPAADLGVLMNRVEFFAEGSLVSGDFSATEVRKALDEVIWYPLASVDDRQGAEVEQFLSALSSTLELIVSRDEKCLVSVLDLVPTMAVRLHGSGTVPKRGGVARLDGKTWSAIRSLPAVRSSEQRVLMAVRAAGEVEEDRPFGAAVRLLCSRLELE